MASDPSTPARYTSPPMANQVRQRRGKAPNHRPNSATATASATSPRSPSPISGSGPSVASMARRSTFVTCEWTPMTSSRESAAKPIASRVHWRTNGRPLRRAAIAMTPSIALTANSVMAAYHVGMLASALTSNQWVTVSTYSFSTMTNSEMSWPIRLMTLRSTMSPASHLASRPTGRESSRDSSARPSATSTASAGTPDRPCSCPDRASVT